MARDWQTIGIGRRTGLKPRGPDSGQRIDGFYVSEDIGTRDLRHLAETAVTIARSR